MALCDFILMMNRFFQLVIVIRCVLGSVVNVSDVVTQNLKQPDESSLTFDDQYYGKWTTWSNCSELCQRYREKYCLVNDIWKVHNSLSECPVAAIREISHCDNHWNCLKKTVNYSMETLDILPENCGKTPFNKYLHHKIIGGRPAKKDSWPWIVNLGYRTEYKNQIYRAYICGATLISDRWAITAAHCINQTMFSVPGLGKLYRIQKRKVFLKTGNYHTYHPNLGDNLIDISHISIHPNYRKGPHYTDYDFALLRFEKPIKFDKANAFPCISNDKTFQLPKTATCYALGWGHRTRENGGTDIDDRLYEVRIPLIPHKICEKQYFGTYINDSLHVCAGGNQKDTCQGDSGGGLYCAHPVTYNWMLFGVTSFGSTIGCGLMGGVYARVSAAHDWINETIHSAMKL